MAEVEEGARQREAPLRMALSDLQAGMGGGGPPAPQLAVEFRRVEARLGALAEELAGDLGTLEARAITVAIERSEVERRRDELLAKIEPILDEILPSYSGNPPLARLAERLRRVRLARGGS